MLQCKQRAAAVEHHADRVEADRGRPWALPRSCGQPLGRESAQSPALARSDRVEGTGRSAPAVGQPRFDLAEHEASPVGGDDVELARPAAEVTLEDGVSGTREVLGGQLLAGRAEASSGIVGHSPDAGSLRRSGGAAGVTIPNTIQRRGRPNRHLGVPSRGTAAPSLRGVLASVATFALEGIHGREVAAEVDVRPGLPAFTVVGLPDAAVREARERVRAALLNSGLDFPLQRLTANLAPASVRKSGPGFDLAIAVGVLIASRQVPEAALAGTAVLGELSLSGEICTVRGALPLAMGARAAGFARLIVPCGNAAEAALVGHIDVVGVPSLARLVDLLRGRWSPDPPLPPARAVAIAGPNLADVRGQADARRALEIAAAGAHNLLMIGPPGAGKTMLARRLPGILPPPTREEALEIARVQSAAGGAGEGLPTRRPFRAPHHTISPQGLVGGGVQPAPGEITLAHRGVLFLDELAEFGPAALDALRQPLEDGTVTVVRSQRSVRYPARAMLVAASNPCPCGRTADCTCSDAAKQRYRRRLSGPLLDRIDIVCHVDLPPALELVTPDGLPPEASAAVRVRVVAARGRQLERLAGTGARANADMDGRTTRRTVALGPEAIERLRLAAAAGALSGRGHDRVLRVARTIADLEGEGEVGTPHVDEALGYRVDAVAEAA